MEDGFRVGMGWAKPEGYFRGRLAEVAQDEVVLLVTEGQSISVMPLSDGAPTTAAFANATSLRSRI